jgi:hypothetical protein
MANNDESNEGKNRTNDRRYAGLAILEIVSGLSIACWGSYASLMSDGSLAGIGALIALVVGILCLFIPGVLLLRSHPLRWVSQILPALVLVWIVISNASK